jgi:hypothetical protein
VRVINGSRTRRVFRLPSVVLRTTAGKTVALEAGLTPGTFANLRRGRLKNVEWIKHKIDQAIVRKLERHIAELQAELVVASHRARRARPAEIADALDALEKSRKLLRRE